MTNVPKLKLKLWQELMYLFFVAIVPIGVASAEVFTSPSKAFSISFSFIGAALIAFLCIKKFLLNDKLKALKDECRMLEHDYSINVGNSNLTRLKWGRCNAIIYAVNIVMITLVAVLLVMFITGLTNELIKFKGASILIFISVTIALILKVIFYIAVGTGGNNEQTE